MRVGRMSPGEFLLDEDVQWVVWSQLVIIGEAANRVSRQDQLKHPGHPMAPSYWDAQPCRSRA